MRPERRHVCDAPEALALGRRSGNRRPPLLTKGLRLRGWQERPRNQHHCTESNELPRNRHALPHVILVVRRHFSRLRIVPQLNASGSVLFTGHPKTRRKGRARGRTIRPGIVGTTPDSAILRPSAVRRWVCVAGALGGIEIAVHSRNPVRQDRDLAMRAARWGGSGRD
jgi:hypothetical protein